MATGAYALSFGAISVASGLSVAQTQFLLSEPARGQMFAVEPNGTVTAIADVSTLPKPEYLGGGAK